MAKELFVIAVGGTGMRCLESFIHLCAIGMFDNCEVDILILDTDRSNGNKNQVEELIDTYKIIRGEDRKTNGNFSAKEKCFFSAKLNVSSYSPDYAKDGKQSFNELCEIKSYDKGDNGDLADLFFDKDSQKLNLMHGYRAQTHLGTFLLYHSLLESIVIAKVGKGEDSKGKAPSDNDKTIYDFISKINKPGNSKKVFVFGSIFGGTGASAIPIIPKVVDKAGELDVGPQKDISYGAIILSNYFQFNTPTDAQKEKDSKIIADSNFFSLNSHAALQFYIKDTTIREKYNALYHLGWPEKPLSINSHSTITVTGGRDQKNQSHILELFSAFAAYDFFNSDDKSPSNRKYLHKEIQDSSKFTFRDLSGESDLDFKSKMTALYSIGLLLLITNNGLSNNNKGIQSLIDRLRKDRVVESNFSIENEKINAVHKYFKLFLFNESNGQLIDGWLYQIKKSANGKQFLYEHEFFPNDLTSLSRIDIEKLLQPRSSAFIKLSFSSFFDRFITELKKNSEQDGSNALDKILKMLYETAIKLQK